MIAALKMLHAFEAVTAILHTGSLTAAHDPLQSYNAALTIYCQLFREWKSQDQSHLTRRIERALLALADALQLLQTDPVEDITGARAEILVKAGSLRARLRRVVGSEGLASFDHRHPEAAECADAAATAARVNSSSGSSPASIGSSWPDPQMSYEQLAHEVLLDPTFRLPAAHDVGDEAGGSNGHSSASQRAHAALKRIFWSGLEDDLRLEPPCYGRVLRMLAHLRNSMMAVAGAEDSALLAELVDEDLLQQRVDAGLNGWEESAAVLGSVAAAIRRMRAQQPSGAAASEREWAGLHIAMNAADGASRPGLLCRMLEFLFRQAGAVRAEVANAKLRRLAPAIAEHGVDYERGKFQARLDAGAVSLDCTRAWLRAALEQMAAARADLLVSVAEGQRAALAEVLAVATARLAAGEWTQWSWGGSGKVPETLQLDAGRLRSLAVEFRCLKMAAAALVAARAAIESAGGGGRSRVEAVAEEVVRALLARLKGAQTVETTEAMTELVTAAVAYHMPSAADAVRSAVAWRLTGPPDRVDVVLRDRIFGVWALAAAGARAGDEGCSPAALGSALEGLWPGVWAGAKRMGRMSVVNREVHGELYSRILREQAAALTAAAAPTNSDAHGSGPPPDAPILLTDDRPYRLGSLRERSLDSDVCYRPLVRRRVVEVADGSCG